MPKPVDPTKRFQGPPCAKCGGTERYKKDRKCVSCGIERRRIRYAEDPYYREREREYARIRYAEDPDYRESVKERKRIRLQDPEVRERKREQDRIRYAQDPEVRERKMELDRIRLQDPIKRDLHNGLARSSKLKKKRQRMLLRVGMTADAIFKALDEVKGHETKNIALKAPIKSAKRVQRVKRSKR